MQEHTCSASSSPELNLACCPHSAALLLEINCPISLQSRSRSSRCCQRFDWRHSAAAFAYRLACPSVCLRSKVQYVQTAPLLVPYQPRLLAALPRTLPKFTQVVTNCCKTPEQKRRVLGGEALAEPETSTRGPDSHMDTTVLENDLENNKNE